MADASMGFATAVGQHLVEHPDDDEFNAHVLAAKAKTTTGEKWRLVAPEQNRGQRKKGQQDSDDIELVDAAIAPRCCTTRHRAAPASKVRPSAYRIERL
jgi:hypothetical protein